MIRLLPRPLRSATLAWGYRLGGWPRRVLVVVLVLAGALAGLHEVRPAADAARDQVTVVVAARAVAAGARLAPADLRVVRWPRALAPPGTATRVDTLTDRYVAGAIGPGEAITRTRLRGAGLTDGMSPGTVAVAVALGSTAAGGFVHPGDHVDLVRVAEGADTSTGGAGTGSAFVVARDVAVLDVAREPDAVSLLVAVDNRQALAIADNDAPILATLRPPK